MLKKTKTSMGPRGGTVTTFDIFDLSSKCLTFFSGISLHLLEKLAQNIHSILIFMISR